VAQTPASSGRLEAIDQFRGFAILLMVLADYLAGIETVPAWLKHAPDIGYTVIDLIAPLFLFAMGLTFGLSFRRRAGRDGYWRTYEHFIARNLALIGLGFLLTLGGDLTGVYPSTVNWGLLQTLGAAGLIALVAIRLPILWRTAAGLGLLAFYQFLLDRYWLADVIAAPHNGPWGALSWGAMLILATALADLYHGDPAVVGDPERARRAYPWVSLAVLGAGLALLLIVPISKHRASASFVLVSLGLSALVFFGFHLLEARTSLTKIPDRGRLPVLSAWGRNALLLYLLHGVVIGLFALPPYPGWDVEAQWWLIVVQAAALLGILSAIGLYLDRRKLYWTL
jgi:predicted acyltransferase